MKHDFILWINIPASLHFLNLFDFLFYFVPLLMLSMQSVLNYHILKSCQSDGTSGTLCSITAAFLRDHGGQLSCKAYQSIHYEKIVNNESLCFNLSLIYLMHAWAPIKTSFCLLAVLSDSVLPQWHFLCSKCYTLLTLRSRNKIHIMSTEDREVKAFEQSGNKDWRWKQLTTRLSSHSP